MAIPKIDVGLLLSGDAKNRDALRKGIHEAGFLILTNCGFSKADLEKVFEAYSAFFALPETEKAKVDMARTGSNRGWGRGGAEQVDPTANPDYKEVFDCGYALGPDAPNNLRELTVYGENLWPEALSGFRETLETYLERAMGISRLLLSAIAQEIGQDPNYFAERFEHPMALLRGNYYPPRPDWAGAKDFGIAAHTDYGCITFLATDGTPGLEVLGSDGAWEMVDAQPPEIVINFGEMLEMWTGGFVRATLHRVRGTEKARISVPLFFNPSFDANVAPVGSRKIILAGDHLTKRFEETYLHLKAG